jgi:hypothetical protein
MLIQYGSTTIVLNDEEAKFFVRMLEDNLSFLNDTSELRAFKVEDEEMEESFPEEMYEDTEEIFILNNLKNYKGMFEKLANIFKVPKKLYEEK